MIKAWQPVSSGHPVSLVTHQALHWVQASPQPPAVSDRHIWREGSGWRGVGRRLYGGGKGEQGMATQAALRSDRDNEGHEAGRPAGR